MQLCISSKNKRPVVIIFFCFFDSLCRYYMNFGVLLEFGYYSRKGLFEEIQLKLNSINGQIIATFLLYSSFLLYFSFSFQAWDSICFYCCWCLTLLDTFVIGEVRWEPQSCYETNTLWSEYKNYVQNLSGLFSFSKL